MKKKGSALILSILMLSFFMTITLTMYYIARNRNKRSIYKIQGMRIDSGLDSGSAIAHYELYLADEYVSQGHPYATSSSAVENYLVTKNYTKPDSTTQYAIEVTSGSEIIVMPKIDNYYTGVVLNNYNEYFASYWDPKIGTATTSATSLGVTSTQAIQPWIAEDKVVDGEIVSRAWLNNTGEKIVRLWTETTGSAISVGGYRLTTVSGTAIDGSSIGAPLEVGKLDSTSPTFIDLTYEKIASISTSDIEKEKYKITYKENVEVTSSGSSIRIDKDILKSMTVEKIN